MFDKKIQDWLIQNAHDWIKSQNQRYLSGSRSLNEGEKHIMLRYFDEKTLDKTRLNTVPVIENPTFYPALKEFGVTDLINFNSMAGITFGECIILQKDLKDPDLSVLFHELVHVVQYEILGMSKFAEEYVLGWINNGLDYYQIPLEVQAYSLQAKYDKSEDPFSVNNYIKELIITQ